MTGELDKSVAWGALATCLGVFLWLWFQAPWVALWPVVSAVAAVVAAAVVWTAVVPGKPTEAGAGLVAGLVVSGEALLEYGLLPAAAWPGQSVAWAVVAVVAGTLAAFGTASGWRTGLRVGLAAALVAAVGGAIVFGAWLGQPVQAVVLEAQGALGRFDASPSTDFLQWSVGDFWSGVAVCLAFGAGLGALAGFAGSLLRRPQTRS